MSGNVIHSEFVDLVYQRTYWKTSRQRYRSAAVTGAWLLAAVSLFSASSASISTPLVYAAVEVEISFGDAGSNGLPAPRGLWP